MDSKYNIKNLVFEGGGSKGAAYAGCVQVLDGMGLLGSIRQVGGTSAGSITAAILATGGGSSGLTNAIEYTHFSRFLDDAWGLLGEIKRSIFNYGLHTGDEFVNILKSLIKGFSGNEDLTFDGLDQLVKENPERFKRLTVVTSNITRQEPQIFNTVTHPDLPIWKAVRASMSIPLIFEPVLIDNEYHVDGGLAWNYPIDIFDQRVETNHKFEVDFNTATLGFFLEPQNLVNIGRRFKSRHFPIYSLKSYAQSLGSYLYETSNFSHMHPEDRKRTVFIDDLGVDGTDFNISKKTIDALIESGKKATIAYFDSAMIHYPNVIQT